MTPAAQEKLRVLRQRLADLEPYPWESVEAWIASARPLIKAHYRDHSKDFADVTVTPTWCQLPRFASGGGRWGGPQRDNFAEASATEEREDRKLSAAAKAKIVGFLDGLLDLPGTEPARPVREAMRSMSKDRLSLLDHEEMLALRGAIITARLSGSRGALLAHISAEFVASLPVASSPGEQVLMDLDALNRAGALTDGSVPLAAWLRNAVQLCGGRQEEDIFVGALERVGGGSGNAARSKATKGAAQEQDQPAAAIVHHHHGDTHMGSKFTTNISGDTKIGAFGQGDNITVTGNLTVGTAGPPTQAEHIENIKAAKKALVDDEEQLGPLVYEALGQFLTMARNIQVDQQSMGQLQAKMKETLDEVWAQQAAKGLRPQALPEGLKVIEALTKSPITAEIAKKLLGV